MKESTRFPIVVMQGSHYQMGRQYGSQCREAICELHKKFDRLLLKPENVEHARSVVKEAIPYVRDAAPELLEDVRGIADETGIDFLDVFRLSCSVELLAWQGCMEGESVSTVPGREDGCSSFALHAREGTLVAWNMDWWTAWQPYVVLLHGMPEDEPSFFAFALAGSVGRPGMSEHVGLAANYLPYRGGQAPGKPNHWEGPGVPYNFLCRIMLKQKNTAETVKAATSVRRMASLNYTIGDVAGDIRCLETTPLDFAEVLPGELTGPGDYLTHANSYLTAKFDGIPECELQTRDPRTADARRQLRSAPRPLDRHTLMQVQCSHFPGEEDGVCVHHQLLDKPGISLLSFIAEVGANRMWAAMGPPCRHEFLEYRLTTA